MKPERMLDFYLRQIAPGIPLELIGEDSFRNIFTTASLLPGPLVLSTFGFECPLDSTAAGADLLVSFQKKNNGPALLKRVARRNLEKSEVWNDIGHLADFWAQQQLIDDFWLEFDIQGNAAEIPSLFFRPLYNNIAELENILSQSLSNLTGKRDAGELKGPILQLAGLLPERATIFQVGAMRSRPVNGIRLCIHEISLDAILTFLEKTPWRGSVAELKDVLILLQPLAQKVTFSIDLGESIGPKIGLECYVNPKFSLDERQAAWVKMLNRLVERGMIDHVKAAALKKFDVYNATEELFNELPEELALATALMKRHSVSTIWRYLHHIKITYNASQPLQAKAYLAVQHVWR